MRAGTLSDAIVILDEATKHYAAFRSKCFLPVWDEYQDDLSTGDLTQVDLPATATSGLIQSLHVLREVKGVAKIEFDKRDIVRHKLVQRIVEAYETFDKEKKANRIF